MPDESRSPDLLQVGFDKVDRAPEMPAEGYPLCDIEHLPADADNPERLRVILAVPGLTRDEIEVTLEGHRLDILGSERGFLTRKYMHREMARRSFHRSFDLSTRMVVLDTAFRDGLLSIDLGRQTDDLTPYWTNKPATDGDSLTKRIWAVLESNSSDFELLTRAAGLDKRVAYEGADLSNVDLTGVDFSGCCLRDTVLYGSNLTAVKFVDADLRCADLRDTTLLDANFGGAQLLGTCLDDDGETYLRSRYPNEYLARHLSPQEATLGAETDNSVAGAQHERGNHDSVLQPAADDAPIAHAGSRGHSFRRKPRSRDARQGKTLLQLTKYVKWHATAIAASVFIILCPSIVYLLVTPPMFTSHASLLIQPRQVEPSGQGSNDVEPVESAIQIIRSETIGLAVVNDLHLKEHPEFAASGSGFVSRLLAIIERFRRDAAPSELAPEYKAVNNLISNLKVSRIGASSVVDIAFQSPNPRWSAAIANAIAHAYIRERADARTKAVRQADAWLRDRITDLRNKMEDAQRAVVEFRTTNNIAGVGSGRQDVDRQIEELNSELVVARAKMAETKARLDRINAVLSSTDSVASTDLGTLPKDNVIVKLRAQFLDLKSREAELAAKYGNNHLATINLRNQMNEVRKAIADELGRVSETYRSDYEIAKQRADNLSEAVRQLMSQRIATDESNVNLQMLENYAQVQRDLYENFLARYAEIAERERVSFFGDAEVVAQASPLSAQRGPDATTTVTWAIGSGILIGLISCLLREAWRRWLRPRDRGTARISLENE